MGDRIPGLPSAQRAIPRPVRPTKRPGTPRTRVVLAGHYPPPFAGVSIHLKQWAHFLSERGVDVEILNLRRGAPPSTDYHHFTGVLTLLHMLLRLPRRSAIFHLHTDGHNWKSWVLIVMAGLAARLKGAFRILTIHSGLMPRYVTGLGALRVATARWALASFTRIICVNTAIARAMTKLGIGESRIEVVPAFLGVSRPGPLAAADDLAIRRFRPLVVAVGGGDADPELGLPLVVRSLPTLRETFPDVGMVFIGWMVGPRIAPLIRRLGLTDRAACLGEVSHERSLALIRHAAVVVRSTFTDGDAISVREALALGVPVVASDTDFRPDGTILFRRGDGADLLRKLVRVLSGEVRLEKSRSDQAGPSGERLWRVYCDVAGTPRHGLQASMRSSG